MRSECLEVNEKELGISSSVQGIPGGGATCRQKALLSQGLPGFRLLWMPRKCVSHTGMAGQKEGGWCLSSGPSGSSC